MKDFLDDLLLYLFQFVLDTVFCIKLNLGFKLQRSGAQTALGDDDPDEATLECSRPQAVEGGTDVCLPGSLTKELVLST